MKRRLVRVIVSVACLAAGFAAGSALRRQGGVQSITHAPAASARSGPRAIPRPVPAELPHVLFDRLSSQPSPTFAVRLRLEQLLIAMPPEEAAMRAATGKCRLSDSFLLDLFWYQAALAGPQAMLALNPAWCIGGHGDNGGDIKAAENILRAWVRLDPAAALAAVRDHEDGPELVASLWAARDPLAAIRALETGILPPAALKYAVESWLARDPASALRWVDEVQNPELMIREQDFKGAATADPEHAGDPVAEWRAETRLRLLMLQVRTDPAAAFAAMAGTAWGIPPGGKMPDGGPWNRLDDIVPDGLTIVSVLSPELAFQYAAALPREQASPYFASKVAQCLDTASPGAGYLWAASLPRGDARDSALKSCNPVTVDSRDFDTAVRLIHRLEGTEGKAQAARALMNAWRQHDPDNIQTRLAQLRETFPAEVCDPAAAELNQNSGSSPPPVPE